MRPFVWEVLLSWIGMLALTIYMQWTNHPIEQPYIFVWGTTCFAGLFVADLVLTDLIKMQQEKKENAR